MVPYTKTVPDTSLRFTQSNVSNLYGTFAPIATAHFFAHVTHTSCIADHESKHDAKGANIFHKTSDHGIAVDPGLFGNVTQWRDSGDIQSR